MAVLKGLVVGLIIGIGAGLWLGVNLGRDKPLLSNPFAEPTLQDSLSRSAGDLKDKGTELMEQGRHAVEKQMDH